MRRPLSAVDRVGQRLGRNELGYTLGSDLDRLAGLRVAAGARGTLGDLQLADTRQGDFAIVLQGVLDDLGELVECAANGGLLSRGSPGSSSNSVP